MIAAKAAWSYVRDAVRHLPSILGESIADARTTILADIAQERVKQLEKWGEQSHPCVPADVLETLGQTGNAMSERFIASEMERAAKADCQRNFKLGRGTWYAIAWEELAESGATTDLDSRREELVQLGAVVVAWLEDVDKKRALLAERKAS